MNRGAGGGLIGLGIVLIVVGAILDWAVTVTTTGFNINSVGLILLIAGIVSVLIGLAMFFMGNNRTAVSRESVNYTPGGRERIVEQRDVGSTF
jgi:hypothetical protein